VSRWWLSGSCGRPRLLGAVLVAGFLWGVIKLVLVIAVVVAALWWLLGRSKS